MIRGGYWIEKKDETHHVIVLRGYEKVGTTTSATATATATDHCSHHYENTIFLLFLLLLTKAFRSVLIVHSACAEPQHRPTHGLNRSGAG